VPGIRAALKRCRAPVVAVTPIIGGRAIKGPAAKMLQELGFAVSGDAVAGRYADFIDAFVTDRSDPLPAPIAGLIMAQAQTLMRTLEDRRALAREVLAVAGRVTQKPA
jgi:LPPG:FO 2-phospho-L-lactate transferase